MRYLKLLRRSSLLLLVLLTLVVSLPSESIKAQDQFAGRWKGSWTSFANARHREHGGPLRVRLKPNGDGTYRGLFAGRFAVVFPYLYRAEVQQYGNQLVSVKRLGPLGEYRMVLQGTGAGMNGRWNAGGESGAIQLKRR